MIHGRLQVLAICHEDPREVLGGMGMHLRELYTAMGKRDDVDVHLLVAGTGEGEISYRGCTLWTHDKLALWKPRRGDLSASLLCDHQLAKTLCRMLHLGLEFDVVHCHEWNALQVARMASDAMQVPLVSTMHLCMSKIFEVDQPMDPAQRGKGEMSEAQAYLLNQEGKLVCESDELICCSRAYVEIARQQYMTDRNVAMIYNGIDTMWWQHELAKPSRIFDLRFPCTGEVTCKLPCDRPLALFVGRLATMKGIEYLLRAVEEQDNGYCVVLCGEVNSDTAAMREEWHVTKTIRRLERRYPTRLRWIGFHEGEDLRDLYAAARVVVMPSTHEPFGIVALEAMAMGCPLIATEVDGLGEIVTNEETGEEFALIIPARSSAAITAALDTLRDLALRSELSHLGRRRACDFSWHVAAQKTVDVYQRVHERADAIARKWEVAECL